MAISSPTLKCLVVDDSSLYRKIVRDVLKSIPGVEVVGIANDGKLALDQIETLKPDLVTLDLEMPRLDGIGVLRELSARGLSPATIMVSAFTARGAKTTTTALQLGAFDFILKPTTSSMEESIQQLRRDLTPKVLACRARTAVPANRTARPAGVRTGQPTRPTRPTPPVRRGIPQRPEIVAIGVSTGGPKSLTQLLPQLPATFPVPIVLVQHMPPMFTKSLAEDLDRRCALHVMEATNGQAVRKGQVLIAPGGKHMKIIKLATGPVVQITDEALLRNCKPSVDYLFNSIAKEYGAKSLGVVLTGMGDDGTEGAKALKQAGASIIAQDEASCVVYGMPKSIVDNGLADTVAPLNQIDKHIQSAFQRRAVI